MQPLVAIVLLWVMLSLPIHLAKVAMLGAAPLGGGFASRAVSYAAGSQLRDTARQHLPAWAGGQPTSSNAQPPQAESRAGTRLRHAATLAGASATAGATGAAAAAAGGGPSAGTSRVRGAAGSTPTGPGATAGTGARTRRRRPRRPRRGRPPERAADSELLREQDFANETFEATSASAPAPCRPSRPGRARRPARDTQRGIGQLVSAHGAGAREHLAYQAIGEWSPEEREALRTLAAASPEIRAQALSTTADTGDPARSLGARRGHGPGGGRRAAAKLRTGPRHPARPDTPALEQLGQPPPIDGPVRPPPPHRAMPCRPASLGDDQPAPARGLARFGAHRPGTS